MEGAEPNEGPWLLKANWSLYALSTIVLALRAFTQIKIRKGLELDDWLMFLAFACGIINMGLITEGIRWGIGRHASSLSEKQLSKATEFEFLSQPWGISAGTLGRVSFTLFLLNFIGASRSKKYSIWALIALQITINLASLIQILVQCEEIPMLWDRSLEPRCMDPRVQEYVGYFQGAFNSLSDMILSLIPVSIVLKLKLERGLKLSLALIMSLSIIVMVASIIRTIEIRSLSARGDFTYRTSYFLLWVAIEGNFIYILSSVPKIRPLYLLWRRKGVTDAGRSDPDSRSPRPPQAWRMEDGPARRASDRGVISMEISLEKEGMNRDCEIGIEQQEGGVL